VYNTPQFFENNPELKLQRNNFLVQRKNLENWYFLEQINAWQGFISVFMQGSLTLKSQQDWTNFVSRLGSDNSPFRMVLYRIEEEFSDHARDTLPSWIILVENINHMRLSNPNPQNSIFTRIKGYFNALNHLGDDAVKNAMLTRGQSTQSELKKYVDTAQALAIYDQGFLLAANESLSGETKDYELAKDFFTKTSDSKLYAVIENYKNLITVADTNNNNNQIVWRFMSLPIQILFDYTFMQASCSLNQDWQKDVIAKTQLVIDPNALKTQLYGDKGTLWTFLDDKAKPFFVMDQGKPSVTKQPIAYINEVYLPITPEFISFLNNASSTRINQLVDEKQINELKAKSSQVTINTLPTSVNPEASAKPYSTSLTLQCVKGETILTNINIATSKAFTWSPTNCGDTTLQIKFDDMTLTRKYPGPLGFYNFLKDFRSGTQIFTPNDFNEKSTNLINLKISEIRVNYNFSEGLNETNLIAEFYKKSVQQSSYNAKNTGYKFDEIPQYFGQCWGASNIYSSKSIETVLQERAYKLSK
jgi:type VI secretion system protein ImpL